MAETDFARLAPPRGATLAIVGACGGIGRAVTQAAIGIGLKVAALDLPRSLKESPPPDGVVLSVALDATDEAQVKSAFARVNKAFGGRLDGLVNLAGFANRHVGFDELSPAEWQETLDGSLKTAYLACRAALPLLKAAARAGGSPAIVNISSGLGVRVRPGFAPYSAAKGAVVAFTKVIAHEAAPAIRANVIAPGAVDTAFHEGGTGRAPDTSNSRPRIDRAAYALQTPAGRMAVAEDMVGPILFLLGPGAGFISGQVLHVNGAGLMPGA